MILEQHLGEAVDGPNRGAQVVGDGVREGLQLIVRGSKLCGPALDPFLKLLLQLPESILGLLPVCDILDHRDEVVRLAR